MKVFDITLDLFKPMQISCFLLCLDIDLEFSRNIALQILVARRKDFEIIRAIDGLEKNRVPQLICKLLRASTLKYEHKKMKEVKNKINIPFKPELTMCGDKFGFWNKQKVVTIKYEGKTENLRTFREKFI